ncbi:MAG: hypothetical protein M3Y56_07900, partial [Armatimonadota bacterium]|nr:hypothetical protein [Armatimonadota bacterium]
AGVRLDIAAQARGGLDHEFVDQMTEAWGWRGIAQTSGVETLTHEVKAAEVLPTLLDLLDWGFSRSAEELCQCTDPTGAEALLHQIKKAIFSAAAQRPEGSLSDLYQDLFPQICEMVSGRSLQQTRVSHSLRESCFDAKTARLPRFRILDRFLAPESRDICIRAYDEAVSGSEIYRLQQFGPGGIPFDLVTRAGGRGTLRILDEGIHVEGRQSDFIPTSRRVESATALAEAVTQFYGEDVNLVGKAITWIAMLAAEYIFIFNEGASSYTHRTASMLQKMREEGVALDVHPLLRVRYGAWDALEEVDAGFCLPDHYAEAFGKREIDAQEFATRWRPVMNEQESLLLQLGNLTRPADLLRFLQRREPERWGKELSQYEAARDMIRLANATTPADDREARELRESHYHLGMEIDVLQKDLGGLRREQMTALSADSSLLAERQTIASRIEELRRQRAGIMRKRWSLRAAAKGRRASDTYQEALSSLRSIAAKAELERLRLARNAYLVVHSLDQNNRRPTGWWLPLVAPDGAWFRAICRRSSAFIEEL